MYIYEYVSKLSLAMINMCIVVFCKIYAQQKTTHNWTTLTFLPQIL